MSICLLVCLRIKLLLFYVRSVCYISACAYALPPPAVIRNRGDKTLNNIEKALKMPGKILFLEPLMNFLIAVGECVCVTCYMLYCFAIFL